MVQPGFALGRDTLLEKKLGVLIHLYAHQLTLRDCIDLRLLSTGWDWKR